jgi:predicted nucleic acid-binding protein
MLLLDTNVFVYASGGAHPLREPARDLLRAADEGRVSVTTTAGVVQEFLDVYAARRTREEAADRAHEISAMCDPMPAVLSSAVSIAVELFRQHRQMNACDCLLAATALRENVDGLVSADRAFAAVADLRWIDLAHLDIEGLAER